MYGIVERDLAGAVGRHWPANGPEVLLRVQSLPHPPNVVDLRVVHEEERVVDRRPDVEHLPFR
jgi:hypothetical protein